MLHGNNFIKYFVYCRTIACQLLFHMLCNTILSHVKQNKFKIHNCFTYFSEISDILIGTKTKKNPIQKLKKIGL